MDQKSDFGFIPLRKVLIALDLDPSARIVAEAGYSLARTMNAQVVFLHVIAEEIYYTGYTGMEYSPIASFSGFNSTDFSVMLDSEGPLKASQYFLGKIKDHLHDDTIQILVEKGSFPEMILKTAADMNTDLIVLGSHSRRWLDQILIGSVTEKVLHHTTIPLFIIPTGRKSSRENFQL